jgi:SAM-dependent methyltransferase
MENLLLLAILLLSSTIVWSCLSLAPWVPTRKKDLQRICELANLQTGENFYDLGCGDGRLVFYTAKNCQANSVGIELALPFYLYCQIRKWLDKNKNVQFKFKNLFYENLTNADVIFIFAAYSEKITDKLKTKLKTELKPGSRIISYVFPITGWNPKIVSKPTNKDLPIYLYTLSS